MFADHRSPARREELVIYVLLVIIGAIPVTIALVQRAAFGVDATLGLLMVLAGLIAAVIHHRRGS